MRRRALVIRLVALLLAGLLSLSPGLGGSVQEATPGAMTGMPPHPAHIHTGTRAELGEVVHPLNDLGMGMPMEMGPMDGPMRQGTPNAAGKPMAGLG